MGKMMPIPAPAIPVPKRSKSKNDFSPKLISDLFCAMPLLKWVFAPNIFNHIKMPAKPLKESMGELQSAAKPLDIFLQTKKDQNFLQTY